MVSQMSFREKNIIFIGFMGVGKTTIGKLVAEKLYRSFIDIDSEIETEFNMSIPDIFDKYGEKVFREKEKELILKHSNERLKVISIGGGAFLQEEIRDVCLRTSIVFLLDMSWESWEKRIDKLIDSRPILQNLSREGMRELFYKRQNIYAQHHLKYNTDHQSSEEVSDKIIESLELEWQLHEPNR